MRTGIILDDRFRRHDTGPDHPERAGRIDAIRRALQSHRLLDRMERIEPRRADDDDILAIHDRAYVDRLRTACATGEPYIDTPDSAISRDSYEVARWAVGSALAAVDAVMSARIDNAFCTVRPPGHHCEHAVSMGFCLLANIAITARHLLDHHNLDRVAVVDWDVHHGNGTQHLFERTARVFFCSLHGHPTYVYPGTGYEDERGIGDGAGATLNLCMYPGQGDDEYRRGFDEKVLPALDDYKPQFVLISAGFDAHRRDPLAPINLESHSYAWMTRAVMQIAHRHAGGRLVSVLEGGYDLDALGESTALHVEQLLDGTDVPPDSA